MSGTKELIERLRAVNMIRRDSTPLQVAIALCHEAADTIERLEAANEAFGRRQEWWTARMFQLETERDAALRVLEALDPHLDAIVCYASTMGEYEPNRLAADARAVVAKYKENT